MQQHFRFLEKQKHAIVIWSDQIMCINRIPTQQVCQNSKCQKQLRIKQEWWGLAQNGVLLFQAVFDTGAGASRITLLTLGSSKMEMMSCSSSTLMAKRGCRCWSCYCWSSMQPLLWWAWARLRAAMRALEREGQRGRKKVKGSWGGKKKKREVDPLFNL